MNALKLGEEAVDELFRVPMESLLSRAGCAPEVYEKLVKVKCSTAALVSLSAAGEQAAFVTAVTSMAKEVGGIQDWEAAMIYGQVQLRLTNIAGICQWSVETPEHF